MKAYAGIGSRKTPSEVLREMQWRGLGLMEAGYTLRTGGAEGADAAFLKGHTPGEWAERAEVYLPWPGFNGFSDDVRAAHAVKLAMPTELARSIAQRFHPSWRTLSRGARMLHARNAHQVLGADCQSPSKFVLCWTPDGAETSTTAETGGTGQAIRIANAYGVPVVNMQRDGWEKRLGELV